MVVNALWRIRVAVRGNRMISYPSLPWMPVDCDALGDVEVHPLRGGGELRGLLIPHP